MSGPPGSSTPKAIGSLAKKQSDVTRQGTQKLKFVPTLPQRRKKEDVKQEPSTEQAAPPKHVDRGAPRGRVRGSAEGRGRGRGRGVPPVVEMTASGPFAMGPSQAGGSGNRKMAAQSNLVPSVSGEGGAMAARSLSQTRPPSLQKSGLGVQEGLKFEEDEVYSDPEDGIEIVDMGHVRQMDWMAPEILPKERQAERRKIPKYESTGDETLGETAVDSTQALSLSESEDEEQEDDTMTNFMTGPLNEQDGSLKEDGLYFFQLPSPFPVFTSKQSAMDVDKPPESPEKRVTFAPDVKQDSSMIPQPASTSLPAPDPSEAKLPSSIEGRIGQLEFYRSGAVKIRLANNVLLDVSAATQPSFLQQAVYLDRGRNQLVVLGEVNKQFVATPNVDALLTSMEEADTVGEGIEDLIKMD